MAKNKSSLKELSPVQSIYKLGRSLYNFKYIEDKKIQTYHDTCIRGKTDIIGNNPKSPYISIAGNNIKEIIPKQRQFDKAILKELDLMQEQSNKDNIVYSSAFTVSYSFPQFKTSIETLTLTTKPNNDDEGFRLSLVPTLKSYNKILTEKSDIHVCWHYIDNNKLKAALKGLSQPDLTPQEIYSCSQIVSLFLCESSRNPSAYLTGPMSLEIAEYEFKALEEIRNNRIKTLDTYKRKLKTIEILEDLGGAEEIQEIESLKQLTEKIDDILSNKSKFTQMQVNKYFPMVMEQAVGASRHIHNLLNQKTTSKELHVEYDHGTPNIARSRDLLKQDKKTLDKWFKCERSNIQALIKDWYGIDTKAFLMEAGGEKSDDSDNDENSYDDNAGFFSKLPTKLISSENSQSMYNFPLASIMGINTDSLKRTSEQFFQEHRIDYNELYLSKITRRVKVISGNHNDLDVIDRLKNLSIEPETTAFTDQEVKVFGNIQPNGSAFDLL